MDSTLLGLTDVLTSVFVYLCAKDFVAVGVVSKGSH